MAIKSFSGDPYLTIGVDGSRLTFIGGQPIMDEGVENQALIALFTDEGWAGNDLFDDPDQKIGSDFIETARQPVTLQSLADIEQAAIRALQSSIFGRVTAEAVNLESDIIRVEITIEPPRQDSKTIILTRNGINWQAQAINPAHERI
jgi:hypothetical protein